MCEGLVLAVAGVLVSWSDSVALRAGLWVVLGLAGVALLVDLFSSRAPVAAALSYFGIGTRKADDRASIALANTLTAQKQRLADKLELKAEHAHRMLRTIESGYGHSLFEPNTPALHPEVEDISTEASAWATSVSDMLREEELFLDARPFEMPEEVDPADVIADHVDKKLSELLDRLDRIVGELRRQPR